MMRNDNPALRQHLLYLLRGGGAHLNFNSAIGGFPIELRGVRPAGLPQTAWRLLEHMRIAQRDILDFCIDSKYIPKDFPSGYWPQNDSPATNTAWDKSIKSFRADLKAMEQLVTNPSTDLFALIPHGEGQTILREALLVADHNAYHLGQMVTLRRLLGAWTDL
ncbi:MAG: DinB family protein [Terriglobia bacterium]